MHLSSYQLFKHLKAELISMTKESYTGWATGGLLRVVKKRLTSTFGHYCPPVRC